jgi:nucleoid-associated protein YgaU
LSKPTLLVILGAVILAAAIALNSLVDWDGSRRDASNAPQTPSASSPGLEAPQIARAPAAPSFDVVRINPNGDAVLAGRATPGSEVTVLEGETVIGRVQADERGEWVLVPDKPLDPGARVFSLESKAPNQEPVKSESEVVLVVPEKEGTGALALRVPNQAGGTGPTTVLQSPFSSSGTGGVAIGVIDYDENGKASVSGKAKPGARLNVYLDEKLAGSAQADKKGEWNFALPAPVSAGEHRLRIDELGPDGKVAGRAEYAFARKPPGDNGLSTGGIVVVEGNSLWRIARRTYGEGTRYMLIVEANREQIKDPDLIYPGQVFDLPHR